MLIFNFRGTGASGGNLDILGWARDLIAAIDYLWSLSEVDKSHLSLLGFSGWGCRLSICSITGQPGVICCSLCLSGRVYLLY